MLLRRLVLEHLRNHARTDIACPEGVLLLVGENGAGKTSILEGISLLCMSRSFVTRQDRGLITTGEEAFQVDGEFEAASRSRRHVRLRYGGMQKKLVEVDYAPLETMAELIGQFPMVALSPQHRPITSGGPGERRAFLDFLLSQVQHSYLMDLLDYRRALRQRNALLAMAEGRLGALRGSLEAWDQALAESGVRILAARLRFIEKFLPYVREAMMDLVPEREVVDIAYAYGDGDGAQRDGVEMYLRALQERLDSDVRRGSTSYGPHRDDVRIQLNDMDVRAQASQGQHKSVLIALKFAEFHYLDERLDERPVLLLDDVFSELDDERLGRVLAALRGMGQTFITTASRHVAQVFDAEDARNAVLRVEAGRVYHYAEVA